MDTKDIRYSALIVSANRQILCCSLRSWALKLLNSQKGKNDTRIATNQKKTMAPHIRLEVIFVSYISGRMIAKYRSTVTTKRFKTEADKLSKVRHKENLHHKVVRDQSNDVQPSRSLRGNTSTPTKRSAPARETNEILVAFRKLGVDSTARITEKLPKVIRQLKRT